MDHKELNNLTVLEHSNMKVTNGGVKELKDALPKREIWRNTLTCSLPRGNADLFQCAGMNEFNKPFVEFPWTHRRLDGRDHNRCCLMTEFAPQLQDQCLLLSFQIAIQVANDEIFGFSLLAKFSSNGSNPRNGFQSHRNDPWPWRRQPVFQGNANLFDSVRTKDVA